MKRIICYGDSNTYGYDAADFFGGRLPEDQRWTDLLAEALHCDVINCGLNGRAVPRYLRSVENDLRMIKRFQPADLVIIMLGTNDILLDRDPEETAEAMTRFLQMLRQDAPQSRILLCSPPRISDIGEGYLDSILELSGLYEEIARSMDLKFADSSSWPIALAADGVHFSPIGHKEFAMRMESAVRELLIK